MGRNVDWDKWRRKYIQGIELAEIAELQGAPSHGTLRNRSSKENWPEQRKRFNDNTVTASSTVPEVQDVAAKVNKIIDTAEMLTRHANLAKSLQGLSIAWLSTLQNPTTKKWDLAKIGQMRPGEVATLLKMGLEVERLTEGLATQRQEIDLSGMDESDLEKLARGGA